MPIHVDNGTWRAAVAVRATKGEKRKLTIRSIMWYFKMPIHVDNGTWRAAVAVRATKTTKAS